MDIVLCACGCGNSPRTKGAKYFHGHHLKTMKHRRGPGLSPVVNICKYCGKEFVCKRRRRRQTYCSNQCKGLDQSRSLTAERINRECLWCHKVFQIKSWLLKVSTGGRYCSLECKKAFRAHDRFANPKASAYRVNAMATRENRTCERCGYSKVPELVLVHHKDGDRSNGALDNLELLCPNCHGEDHFQKDGCVNVPSANHAATHRRRKADRLLGLACSGSKLSPHQVQEIARLASEGSTPKKLALQFNVSRENISGILRGKTWGWLTGIKKTMPTRGCSSHVKFG